MADNKNMAINDEEMKKAAGSQIGLPLPKYKEWDRVKVKGYEQYDAEIAEVLKYLVDINSWHYEVHIFNPNGTTLIQERAEKSIFPA